MTFKDGNVVKIHDLEYFSKYNYVIYDDKGMQFAYESAYDYSRSATGSNIPRISEKIMGADLKINEICNSYVRVKYNRANKDQFIFNVKLEEWAVEKVYTVEDNPEYFI